MKIQGILTDWGRNERGYRWVSIEGLRLDLGKDGKIADSVLDALVGQEVVVHVQVEWVRSSDGRPWSRRRVLAMRSV